MLQALHFPSFDASLAAADSASAPGDQLPLRLVSLIQPAALPVLASCASVEALPMQRLVWELQANGLLMRFQKLSGLEGLLPDPHLYAGGLVEDASCEALANLFATRHPETHLDLALTLWVGLTGEAAGDAVLESRAGAPQSLPPGMTRALLIHYWSRPALSPE